MSYSIEPMSVKLFVTDGQMKLPRFQRKATWNEKQNFELAISIFQDYPVGVVIVNKETDSSWLLDGRQRRNALKEMRSNPNLVYLWAKKYINFKPNEDISDLKTKYWGKVEEYLQKDKSEDEVDDTTPYDGAEIIEDSFNATRQRKGLETLLNIILMVHQMKTSNGVQTGAWERIFNFTKFFSRLSYAPQREGGNINPVRLRDFLLKLGTDVPNLSEESFCEYYEDNFDLLPNKKQKFEEDVTQKWSDIQNCIKVILQSEKIIEDARIGIIQLTNVSPLDAQNIFSRVNSGGTQLKAEELLSAKPFWNEKVNTSDPVLKQKVIDLYKKLDVEVPEDIVKWDLGATLVDRINDQGLLFELPSISNEINMERVTLGFKLISSVFLEGMSAKVVNDLEKKREINWDVDIDNLVKDINQVCEILMNSDHFRYFQSWNKPISKLLGNAIVLEFISIVLKDWNEKGRPTVSGSKLSAVTRDAKILFDRLIFEYAVGVWRGSGDSKMAAHISDWKNRIVPISSEAWKKLIEGACENDYNGQTIALKHITPIIYYSLVLKEIMALSMVDMTYDVDHIMPQAKFNDNPTIDIKYRDCLANLALLPKKDNISKKDKELQEITTSWLKQSISKFAWIEESDFVKYSDIANFNIMKVSRTNTFKEIFDSIRTACLSN